MPGLDGIEATRALKQALPSTRVLIVTTFGRPGFLRRALQAGADGFVVKDTPARQLADAVRRVHAGLRVVDPVLAADSLVAGDSPLTARETDVLRAARDGSSVAADRGRGCSCPRGPCATTCRPPSARPGPPTVPRRPGSRTRTAGCDGLPDSQGTQGNWHTPSV